MKQGPALALPHTQEHPPTQSCVWSEDQSYCNTHRCKTRKLKLTSKKWTWLKKRNCYGWTSRKVERIACTHRKQANKDQDVIVHCSNNSDSSLGVIHEVGGDDKNDEVGGLLFTRQLSDRDRCDGGLESEVT